MPMIGQQTHTASRSLVHAPPVIGTDVAAANHGPSSVTNTAHLHIRVGNGQVLRALSGESGAAAEWIARDVRMQAAGMQSEPIGTADNSTVLRHMRSAGEVIASVQSAGGRPLPKPVLQRMQTAFQHDFGHVRIHTDGAAAKASDDLQAHAFALGAHVFFGSGTFAPGTPSGDRLLLHELTHVVQHDEGRIPVGGPAVSSPSDPLEQEAYANENTLQTALAAADTGMDFGLGVAVGFHDLGAVGDVAEIGPDAGMGAVTDVRAIADKGDTALLDGKHDRKPRLDLNDDDLNQLADLAAAELTQEDQPILQAAAQDDDEHDDDVVTSAVIGDDARDEQVDEHDEKADKSDAKFLTHNELMDAISSFRETYEDQWIDHQPVDKDQRGDWDAVHDQAEQALPAFSEIVSRLTADTQALTGVGGGDTKHKKAPKKGQDDVSIDEVQRSRLRRAHKAAVKKHSLKPVAFVPNDKQFSGTADLKGKERSDQKATGKYGGRYDRLLDIVRGTLTFRNFEDLMNALGTIWDKRLDYGYDIQRCKQTYLADPQNDSSRHRTLYGDVKLNLVEAKTKHVCELQLTIQAMWEAKIGGHRPYEQYRDANPFDKRLGDLQGDEQRGAKAAVRDSHRAYGDVRSRLEKDKDYKAAILLAEEFSAFVANKGPPPDGFM